MRLPSKLAAVVEHLREAVVVLGGGDHAAAARRHGGLRGVVAGPAAGGRISEQLAVGAGAVERREAVALVGGHVEARVVHAQRTEDVVAHEVGQRLAGELLDDVALDVHRHAVGPAFAGLIEQRNLGELVDELLEVF